MDIEISPTEVMRCASGIESAVARLGGHQAPACGGNAGFSFDAAISRFGSLMQQTSDTAADDITTTSQDLDASAQLLRKVDDAAQSGADALWSKIR